LAGGFAFVAGFGDLAGGTEKFHSMLAIEVADLALNEEGFSRRAWSSAGFATSDAEVQEYLAQEFLRVSVVVTRGLWPGPKPNASTLQRLPACQAQ